MVAPTCIYGVENLRHMVQSHATTHGDAESAGMQMTHRCLFAVGFADEVYRGLGSSGDAGPSSSSTSTIPHHLGEPLRGSHLGRLVHSLHKMWQRN